MFSKKLIDLLLILTKGLKFVKIFDLILSSDYNKEFDFIYDILDPIVNRFLISLLMSLLGGIFGMFFT